MIWFELKNYEKRRSAKSFAAFETATSIGRRSVDDPVQNPWPVVLSSIY